MENTQALTKKERAATAAAEKAAANKRLLASPVEELTRAERDELYRRAEEGDESALPQVRRLMDLREQRSGANTTVGEMAITSLITRMSGKDLHQQELFTRTIKALRAKLTGSKSTPLEDLLIDRICATWLQVQYFEALNNQSKPDRPMYQAVHAQDCIDRANRRYLAAIKALAQVRRLNLPAVQVNIGERQVNVLQTGGGHGQQENLPAGSIPCLPDNRAAQVPQLP